MPPRKRHKTPERDRDPVVRFAESVRRSDERAAAERQRLKEEKAAAELAAQRAAEHALVLAKARRALDRAIVNAKAARASGKGTAEADAAWRVAKARLIELETGAPPPWTPTPPPAPDREGEDASG